VLFNKADPGFVEQLGLPCFCVRHSAILADGVRPCKSPRVRASGDRTRNAARSGV
jgi:hypothetical protein